MTKIRDRIEPNEFQRLVKAIQEGSERELESAIRAIASTIRTTTTNRRSSAVRKPSR